VYLARQVDDIIETIKASQKIALWVCDSTTTNFLAVPEINKVVLESGEISKKWDSVEQICAAAVRLRMGRDGVVIGFGGGVVCDIAGFAASMYMRGCSLALVPTTLLAMVDASLGGKTAIDIFGIKNLVGSFYPARHLYLCPPLLSSLPVKEFINGLGEVIKHALLSPDSRLMELLETKKNKILSLDTMVLQELVIASLEVKRRYIESDPREEIGLRAMLNLGHTFAHALETVGNLFSWSHGEAVAWGTVKALQAGVALRVTDEPYAHRAIAVFESYGFDIHHRVKETKRFLEALEGDKKRSGSSIRFVIMQTQGKGTLQHLDQSLIISII